MTRISPKYKPICFNCCSVSALKNTISSILKEVLLLLPMTTVEFMLQWQWHIGNQAAVTLKRA